MISLRNFKLDRMNKIVWSSNNRILDPREGVLFLTMRWVTVIKLVVARRNEVYFNSLFFMYFIRTRSGKGWLTADLYFSLFFFHFILPSFRFYLVFVDASEKKKNNNNKDEAKKGGMITSWCLLRKYQ